MKTEDGTTGHNERLQEIAAMTFGSLSDDEALRLLAERKRLEELQREYERLQEEEKSKEMEKKKETLTKAIEKLNRSISPDKADDELLALVAERKELEKELENIGADTPLASSEAAEVESAALPGADIPEENLREKKEQGIEESIAPSPETAVSEKAAEPTRSESGFKESLKEEFGSEGILEDDFREGGELHRYLDQLKNNTGSLGTLLQEMPIAAKRNKKFMLKVAEIDSAYAMHYADKDTLKKDEDFNIRIATMKNPRNSGNAIAEMLPEARTSKVVLASVKQDYRNIKFVQPNMEEYDEMMRIAKKAALERVKDLKDAADMMLLIPRPLQQDKQFMDEVKKITAGGK